MEEILLAFSQRTTDPKFNPLQGDLQAADDLSNALPSMERLRRQTARQQARKLYSRYHADLNDGKAGHLVDFGGLRALVNSGEVEIIRYLQSHYEGGVDLHELDQLLDIRMEKLRSLPSFRLVALYQSGSPEFEVQARKILLNKERLLDQRLGDLYTQGSTNEAHHPQG